MAANIDSILLKNTMSNSANENWRSYHQECADFALPRKANINSLQIRGARLKFNFLYDSTAIRSLKVMGAGFHSNLSNPATKFFGWLPKNGNLKKDRTVSKFFEDCRDIHLDTLNQTNYDSSMQEWYSDFGGFGTAALLQLKDPQSIIRFLTIPIEQLSIEEDMLGRIHSVFRNFQLNAFQAYMAWGSGAGKEVAKAYAEKKYHKMFDFLHYVGPRMVFDMSKKDAVNMPFESVWISKFDKHLIKESGFKEMPYHIGRFWKQGNDPFGYGPTMDALVSIKLLNAQKKTTLRGAMKATDPALQLPSRGYVLPLNLNPGALNYRLEGTNSDELKELPVGRGNFNIAIEMMQMEKDAIEEAYFVPLFRALTRKNKQMTVPEVEKVIAENMVLLGPVVGRVTNEFLQPMLLRGFNIHMEEGQFPEVPEALSEQEFLPIYLSPLARAQRESELTSIDDFMVRVTNMGAIYPNVFDKIDEDKTVDLIADVKGITPEILRDDRAVLAIRQGRMQAAEKREQMEMLKQTTAIAKEGTQAEKMAREAEAATR